MSESIQHKKVIAHLSKDEQLAKILPEIELPYIEAQIDIYPKLLHSIVGQQLSVKVASVIYRRFEALYGNAVPTPEILLETPIEVLRTAGLSRQKSQYLHNIAQKFIEENWIIRNWQSVDNETLISELTSIKGVGEWTAQMILMFALAREDIFAIKDLVVRQEMTKLYKPKALKGKALINELTIIAEKWKPYRSFGCHALWRAKDAS